jgi:hypothetical protein
MALVVVLALLITTGNAMAQNKKYEINAGGGFTAATGDIEEHFGNGGHIEGGFTFFPKDRFGIQFQYAYSKLNGKDFQLPVSSTIGGATINQNFDSHMHMHGLVSTQCSSRNPKVSTSLQAPASIIEPSVSRRLQ